MVKNPGKEKMEIITKEGQKINRDTPTEDQANADGTKGKITDIKLMIHYEKKY
jgi:hypothetical protein